MADPDAIHVAFFMARYYCPLCGDIEHLGERCGCGLLWNESRRQFGHYAVLLSPEEGERLRHKLSRKQVRGILARCVPEPVGLVGPPKPCVRRALARMWEDPP